MKGVIIHAYSNFNVFILNLGCIYDIDVPLDTTGTTFCFLVLLQNIFAPENITRNIVLCEYWLVWLVLFALNVNPNWLLYGSHIPF